VRGGEGKALPVETFNAAVGALDRGETAEAVRLFREAVSKSPDLVEAWNGLGLGLLRLKDMEGANAALSRALALAPRYVPALLNAGLLRLEQGRLPEAAELFSRAVALSPESPAPRVNLAVAQLRLGRTAEAEETLLAARRRFPGDADVLYQLGVMYERMGLRGKSADAYMAFLAASAGGRPDREARVRERLLSWSNASRLDAEPPRPPQ
jgi:Flp pilus assembly protein TadD